MEELLNIFNTLNRKDITDEDKQKIQESLDNLEEMIINSDRDMFGDNNKFSLLMKLVNENRKLLNKINRNSENSDKLEMEAIKATFGSGGSNGNYTKQPHMPNSTI